MGDALPLAVDVILLHNSWQQQSRVVMAGQHSHHRGSITWDGLGAGVSLACALHCAALPLVFGLLPGLQLALLSWDHQWQGLAQWLLWSHEAEGFVVGTVLVFAGIVLSRGFMKHRDRWPIAIAGSAGTLMAAGAFGHWHDQDLLHVSLQVAGGLGVASAHILNLRALRKVGAGECHGKRRLIVVAAPRM